MILIRNLYFSYQKELLKALNLEISKGQVCGILGENGSGKSTLLKLMRGMLEPDSGDVLMESEPLSLYSSSELAQKIAWMSPQLTTSFNFEVQELLYMSRHPFRDTLSKVKEQHILDITDTKHLLGRVFNECSSGEQKRIQWAMMIAQEADVLLLDEPFEHLDLRHQFQFVQHVKEWAKTYEKTIVIVSHHIPWLAAVSDRLCILSDGHIKLDGEPHAVMHHPEFETIFGLSYQEYSKILASKKP